MPAKELLDFEIRVSQDASDRYGAFIPGMGDDLVTALGLVMRVQTIHYWPLVFGGDGARQRELPPHRANLCQECEVCARAVGLRAGATAWSPSSTVAWSAWVGSTETPAAGDATSSPRTNRTAAVRRISEA